MRALIIILVVTLQLCDSRLVAGESRGLIDSGYHTFTPSNYVSEAVGIIDRLNVDLKNKGFNLEEWVNSNLLGDKATMDPQVYSMVAANLGAYVASNPDLEFNRSAMLTRLAARALQDNDNVEPIQQNEFSRLLWNVVAWTQNNDYIGLRRQAAETTLKAWQLQQEMLGRPPDEMRQFESDFIEKAPKTYLNMMPPVDFKRMEASGDQAVFSGMAASSIKDPIIRAQYEQMLEENSRNQKYKNHVIDTARDFQTFGNQAESFLVKAYSRGPSAPEEIAALLQKYIPDDRTKERIVEKLSQRLHPEETKHLKEAFKVAKVQSAANQSTKVPKKSQLFETLRTSIVNQVGNESPAANREHKSIKSTGTGTQSVVGVLSTPGGRVGGAVILGTGLVLFILWRARARRNHS